MFINALLLAVLLPTGATAKAESGPSCRAQLVGHNLTTTVELPGGQVFEGPWRVRHRGTMEGETAQFTMFVTIDRVVERDVLTGEERVRVFPQMVSLVFEGKDQKALVQQAAQVWCVTVMRAQENQALEWVTPQQKAATRITAVPNKAQPWS